MALAAFLGAPPLAAAPQAAPTVLNGGNLLETAAGLAVVLGLVLGLAWVVKRYLAVPGASKGRIQVVGGVSLGPRERAVIVEVEGERLLLGVAQGNVRMLHHLPVAPPAGAFSEALAQAADPEEAA